MLTVCDFGLAIFTTADGLFLVLAVDVFIDSIPCAALLAIEFVTLLAIELCVLKGKLCFTTLIATTVGLLLALGYQLPDFWISG